MQHAAGGGGEDCDEPNLILEFPASVTIIGTIGCNTTGTAVVINGYIGGIITSSITIGIGDRFSVGLVGGAGSTSRPCWATR